MSPKSQAAQAYGAYLCVCASYGALATVALDTRVTRHCVCRHFVTVYTVDFDKAGI